MIRPYLLISQTFLLSDNSRPFLVYYRLSNTLFFADLYLSKGLPRGSIWQYLRYLVVTSVQGGISATTLTLWQE